MFNGLPKKFATRIDRIPTLQRQIVGFSLLSKVPYNINTKIGSYKYLAQLLQLLQSAILIVENLSPKNLQ